jgi:hypothetical protein
MIIPETESAPMQRCSPKWGYDSGEFPIFEGLQKRENRETFAPSKTNFGNG